MAEEHKKNTNFPANFTRALRLPFVSASLLPFILGSFIAKSQLDLVNFLLGLTAVISMHLSANLINDYADSKSGADWRDLNFYAFFGGSKLIQEKTFSESFYRKQAVFFAGIAGLAVCLLSFSLKSISILGFFLAILFLAWSYSARPFRFSCRRLGEFIIFILFGPALVMGGFFIQTKIFPTLQGFMLSLPVGFLVVAILFANEVPDFADDRASAKFTWVSLLGPERSYILYYVLVVAASFSILLNFAHGFLTPFSFFAFIFLVPAFKAARILRKSYQDKLKLVESSKLTILAHSFVTIVLILDLLLCKKL